MIKLTSITSATCAILSWAAPAVASPCELHVWPTTNLGGATMATGMAGVLPALMAGRTDKQKAVLSALLNPAGQIEQLKKSDLSEAFGLSSDTETVFHDPSDVEWRNNGRNTASMNSCYYEFKIDSLIFNRHPLYGKDILAFLTFRKFGLGDKVLLKSSDRVRTKMPSFPQKVESDPASVAAAASLVDDAFNTDVKIFADRVKR